MSDSQFFIAEPDVAISDFLLAIECSILFWCLRAKAGRKRAASHRWFLLYFAAGAVAALAGGAAHGFFPETDTTTHFLLWSLTLAAVGANGLACWNVGASQIGESDKIQRRVLWFSTLSFVAYSYYVFTGLREFTVAMAAYLPPILFLLAAFVKSYLRVRNVGLACGIASILLTLVGGLVIQLKISLHPLYMTSSTVFHVIQGVSAFLMFKAAGSIEAE